MTSYEDTLNRMVKQEDTPRIQLAVSILRPLLMFLFQWHLNYPEMEARLKHIDNVVEKINRDFKPPKYVSNSDHVQLVPFNLNILKSLKEDINEIVCLHNCRSVSSLVTWENAEHVVSFINSLSQILKDISISEGEAQSTIFVVNPMKKEIVQLEERLMFLINFLWLTTNPLFEFGNKKVVLNSAQRLAVEILHKLFLCFLGDDELVADHTREDILPYLLRKIDTLLLEIMHLYRGSDSIRLPDGNRTMNEHILGFVDHLIHKLKLLSRSNNEASFVVAVKVQMEILVDELNFLRHSLMDLLLQVPDVKMTISTLALIVEIGFFVYLSLHKQEGGELTDKYSSSGLPDLLEAVHTIRQQASDLFSSRFPWLLQSNYLSTNKLKIFNSMIEELEDLMCSKAARIVPLKHQIEMINKEMLTLRKYFGEISKLENTQMELLFTRFVDAANLAKYVTDSFLAGEDSLWFQKLGLYVITKDMRNMQKEIKSLLELTCPTPTNVQNVAVASSLASSQANYPPNVKAAEMQNKKSRSVIREDVSGGIAVLYGGFKRHKLNLLHLSFTAKVPHICSLLYFRKSVIDMDYAGREDPDELVESGALSPRSRNYLSEQVFRNLLSVGRYNLSELVVLGNSASATDSVKQILEDQRDLSNDQLKIIVIGEFWKLKLLDMQWRKQRRMNRIEVEGSTEDVYRKPIDEAVKNMIRDFEPPPPKSDDDDDSGSNKQCGYSSPTNLQLLLSNLNKLKSLKEEIKEIILDKDIAISEAQIFAVNPIEKEIEQLKERLKFLINFLWLVIIPQFEFENKKVIWNSAQKLAVEISQQLFLCFVGDYAGEDTFSITLPDLLRKIHILLLEIIQVFCNNNDDNNNNGSIYSIRLLPDPDGNHTMNEHVLGFVDYLINKLTLLSRSNNFTAINILVDELSFIRALFTTQSHAVALEAKSQPYALHLLSSEESYELLSLKLFNGDACPKELSVISRRIASNCKGLPLSLVLIAGTLKKTKKKKGSWEQERQSLMREEISGGIAVLYSGLKLHKLNSLHISSTNKVLHIWPRILPCMSSSLYFHEDPPELVEFSNFVPRIRNYVSEQEFRNLLSISRYDLSEQACGAWQH
ncbi:hypothetical protein ACH5RR_026734 [Cinchona calisaya]|uniref:Late blight resistance protein R1A-like N-terminal domain-containing protein n=1 Tax=Cinchona calisaya TaxID=153742 RepID=A0ABD2Z3F0_9GENT